MNTRTRSAAKAQKAKPVEVKKEEPIAISDNEDVTSEDDGDNSDEPEYVPKSMTKRRQTQSRAPKKEPEEKPKRASAAKPKTTTRKSATGSKVKQESSEVAANPPPEENEEFHYDLSEKEMKEANHAFDMNHLGNENEVLNSDGLRAALRSLGFEPRGDEIQKLTKRFGNKKGEVTRDGFHKIMAYKYSLTPSLSNDTNSNDEISRVFNLLDLDKTGFITIDNLKSIAKELNEDLTEEELMEMINEADTDGDFQINKDDFYKIMKKTNLY